MRARRPREGIREALAAEYRRMAELYGAMDAGWSGRFADRIDAGEPVVVWAYEVDLLPPHDRVCVEPDGTVHRINDEINNDERRAV